MKFQASWHMVIFTDSLSTVLMENISTPEQLILLEYTCEIDYYSKIKVGFFLFCFFFCEIIQNLKAQLEYFFKKMKKCLILNVWYIIQHPQCTCV